MAIPWHFLPSTAQSGLPKGRASAQSGHVKGENQTPKNSEEGKDGHLPRLISVLGETISLNNGPINGSAVDDAMAQRCCCAPSYNKGGPKVHTAKETASRRVPTPKHQQRLLLPRALNAAVCWYDLPQTFRLSAKPPGPGLIFGRALWGEIISDETELCL
jgi:hypothetical protein